MQKYIEKFSETIISGRDGMPATALAIREQIVGLLRQVDDIECKTNELKDYVVDLVKFIDEGPIKDKLNHIEFYKQSIKVHMHIKALVDSFNEVDIKDINSFLTFKNVLKEELTQLFAGTTFLNEKIDIGKIVEKIFDILSQFLINEHTDKNIVEDFTQDILSILDELNIFKGNPTVREIVEKYLLIFLDVVSISLKSIAPVINNNYADKQVVFNYLRPSLPQVENILKNVKNGPKEKGIGISLVGLWDAGNELLAIRESDGIQEVLTKSRKGVELFFAMVQQSIRGNEALSINLKQLENTILHWLTLDDEDFRAENIVELLHFIALRMQDTIIEYKYQYGNTGQYLYYFLDKLNVILKNIDNNDFKLLITPKEDIEMHKIHLPDIFPQEKEVPPINEEESEKPKSIEEKRSDDDKTLSIKDETRDHKTEANAEQGETNEHYKGKKFTLDQLIYFLCFDKEYGATAKMDPILADVIHDLYYRDWLSYRLEHLEDEVMSIFTLEKYQPIWEDIKAKLLDEKGVNLGEFVTYLIEKVVGVVNELITFVKDTIQYIIDEIFNLVKAIIQFFEKVDLPKEAKDFIKSLPLFKVEQDKKNMPDDVTILHIIAAIPYTLYQEFISFEVPKSEAV